MTLLQFLYILQVRWRLAVTIFVAVVAISGIAAWYAPRLFEATAVVLVDFKEPISGQELSPFGLDDYLTTQLDIINSRRVALEVAEILQLKAVGSVDSKRINALQKGLSAELSSEGSRLIEITYRARDAKAAARYANAFAKAYRQTVVETSVEPATRTAEWLEKQMAELLSKRQDAQRRLTSYQQEHGILATKEPLDIETERLTTLTRELIAAQARTQAAESRLQEMRELQARDRLPGLIPQLLASTQQFLSDHNQMQDAEERLHNATNRTEIDPGSVELGRKLLPSSLEMKELRDRLVLWEARLKEISEEHPDYKRIQTEVQTLRQNLQEEVDGLFMTLERDVGVARAQENALEASLADQRNKILRLQRARDQIPTLLNEVEAAQKAYERLRARYNEYRMQSQANITNVSILTPALSPETPINPSMAALLLVAATIGLILGVAIVLLLEIVNRRIHSKEDIIDHLHMPLLLELRP